MAEPDIDTSDGVLTCIKFYISENQLKVAWTSYESVGNGNWEYLLTQMQEKYGIEFSIAGREDLKNYGPFHGATYFCEVSPVDAPEQIATAVVSQTDYQDVRDDYAIYYFEEDAVVPVLALCGTKNYVIDQRISLEMPETEKLWTAEDKLDRFLSESGAYVKLVLRFTDDLNTEIYAEYLHDFLTSVDQLECNLLLQAKANKVYIFHEELDILDGFDASRYTVEDLTQEIESFLSIGAPKERCRGRTWLLLLGRVSQKHRRDEIGSEKLC